MQRLTSAFSCKYSIAVIFTCLKTASKQGYHNYIFRYIILLNSAIFALKVSFSSLFALKYPELWK